MENNNVKGVEAFDKRYNGLKVFGTILTYLLLYIAQIHLKIKIINFLEESNQNSKREGEN